jgi:O-antigen ligase
MIIWSGGPLEKTGGVLLSLALFIALPLAVFSPKGLAPVFIAAVLGALLSLQRDGIRQLFAAHPARKAVAAAILVFVGYGIVSALWSVDPQRSVKVSITVGAIITGGVILLAAIRRYDPADRHRLRRACLYGFGLALLLVVIELCFHSSINRFLRDGPEFYLIRVNELNFIKPVSSLFGVFLFPLAAIALSSGRLILAAGILAAALGTILYVSVSSAAVAAALGLSGALLYILTGKRALQAASLAVILVSLAMPLMPGQFPPAGDHYAESDLIPSSANHRFRTWQFTAQRIAEKPLLGWGMDSARHVPGGEVDVPVWYHYDDGRVEQFVERLMPLHPHNWFLQIWVELGAVGAFLMTAIIVLALRWIGSVGRSRAQTALLFGQAIAIISTASLSFGAWQNWWLGTIFLSFAVAATVEHDGGRRHAAG